MSDSIARVTFYVFTLWRLRRRLGLLVRHDLNVPGLFFAKAQVISTKAEFNWIAHGRTADDFHTRAVTEAHFQKAAAQIRIPTHAHYVSMAADAELVQTTGGR